MTSTTRVIWNGAISFGLVNIPVALHTATSESGLDFEWLDKRTLDPVGYKRINKKTGQEIDNTNIVKGIKYEDGRYVVLTEDEIRRNLAKSTQSIEIESFVTAAEIPLAYFERPYYLAPINRGDKAYALLRETLGEDGAGRDRPGGDPDEAAPGGFGGGRPGACCAAAALGEPDPSLGARLKLPPLGTEAAGLTERELAMAEQLVDAMAAPWEPEKFEDSFTAKVMALVEEKARAAGSPSLRSGYEAEPAGAATAEVIDFTELLRRSLHRPKAGRSEKPPAGAKTADRPAGPAVGR